MAHTDISLRQIVGYNLTRSNTAVLGSLSHVLSPFGLRRITFSALNVVAARPGLRQADLADALAIDRANLVLIVGELETAGLMTRTRSDEDRRAYALKVTQQGAALNTQASLAVQAFDQAMTKGLTKSEREILIQLLQKVERNASQHEVTDDTNALSHS